MTQPIPDSLRASRAFQLVISQGWEWRQAPSDQIVIEICPLCHKSDWKFYMKAVDPAQDSRDGLWFCHKCQKTGHLNNLKEHLGLRIPGIESRGEWAGKEKKQDDLPDVELCHAALLSDAVALDYLVNSRGFTEEVIRRQKLGLKEKVRFTYAGETAALVYPYLVGGNIVYAKYRTIPPTIKDFISPKGWEAPLYNGEILQDGCTEIIFVEGEANTVSLMSHGIDNVVGVPGAGIKKAEWIEAIDRIQPKVYIFYDNDKAGKKGAQDLASRIGIDKCYRIVIPLFTVTVPADECKACDGKGQTISGATCLHQRPGKDFNEWMQKGGGSKEAFEELKKQAQLFDVTGVTSSGDALEQLEEKLAGKTDLAPTYVSPWPSLNRLVGFEDGDVIDVVAPGKVGKTTFGLNLIDHMTKAYGEDGLIVCMEMTQERLARKWVSIVTGFEDIIHPAGSPEAQAKLDELRTAIGKAKEEQRARAADLYFAYPQNVKDPEDVFKLIRDCVRRYGVKWVMLDNLQLLCDNTLRQQNHRTVHLSQISKGSAKLAKDYKIKLLRIVQPRRIANTDMITVDHVDGSSQIDKDCDAMMILWRKSQASDKRSAYDTEADNFEEGDESFDPKMKVTVALSRYFAGGYTWLCFDGARSQVREYTEEEKGKRPAIDFNAIVAKGEAPVEPIELPKETI